MSANLIESFKVMGLGMIGIFAVALVLMLIIVGLKKLFPVRKPDQSEQDNK